MSTKKIITLILCTLMVLSVIPVTAFAGNGPFQGEGAPVYLGFFETDEDGDPIMDGTYVVYNMGKVVDINVEGIKYDLATNTLTMKDCDMSKYVLEATMMGDDLKFVVEGNVKIGAIHIIGWSWGGSLEIQGSGTLTVNEAKVFDEAIALYPEGDNPSILKLGRSVNLNLYSKKDTPVVVYGEHDPKDVFSFANDPTPPTGRVENIYKGEKHIAGFFIDEDDLLGGYQKCTCKSDPNGVYGASSFFREFDENNEPIYLGWWVYRYIYNETFGIYFEDPSFGERGQLELTIEEFEKSDYSAVYDANGEPVYNQIKATWLRSDWEEVFTDGKGNEYILRSMYHDDVSTNVPYTFEPVPEIPGYYAFKKADGVDPDKLEIVEITEPDGTFNTVITGSEYIYRSKNPDNPFDDVPDGQWFTEAALWCNKNGYMNGTGAATFAPDMKLTRAMFVQILAKVALGDDLQKVEYKGSFSDVKESDWFAKAVQWAVDNGITKGMGEGKFCPDTHVTREQLATFFMAYAKFKGYDVTATPDEGVWGKYSDTDEISDWALSSIRWAVAEELISGTSNTTISPKTVATRAQAAVIFKKFVENH